MQIKLSKAQWEAAGKKAGWLTAQELDLSGNPVVIPPWRPQCKHCGEPLHEFDMEDDMCPKCRKLHAGKPFKDATYTYHINLNERGSFYADVRNSSGKTVFTIKAGNELGTEESSIFEDGYMKHIHDMQGLQKYLVSMGIMTPYQTLKDMQPNER